MSDAKRFISPQQLMEDSLELGRQILASGFRPDYIVGVWRGGTPVGIMVQELLDFYGIHTDHISIRTSSYAGPDDPVEGVTGAGARAELSDQEAIECRGLAC